MAKPLTSRKLLTLKEAAGEGPFDWILLQTADRSCACIPVMKRTGGLMLALPSAVFSAEELDNGSVEPDLPDIGPWIVEAIPVHGTTEDQTVDVLFLDFPITMFGPLRYFQRKAVWPAGTMFFDGASTAVLPDEEELVLAAQAWVTDGKPRAAEGYHTALEEPSRVPAGAQDQGADAQGALDAVLQQLTSLASTVTQLQADMGEMRQQQPVQVPEPSSAPRSSALARAKALAGPVPKTRAVPPPLEAEEFQEDSGQAEAVQEGEDLDTMLKAALLQLMKPKKKKHASRHFLGLQEGSSDSEPEEDPLKRLHGAKGTMLQEKLRHSMDQSPAQYVAAVEANAAHTLGLAVPAADTLDRYSREEMPIGSSKILGYLTMIIVKAATLLRAKEVEKAHLVLVLALAAIEQAQLDGNWETAWRLTRLPQPPFAEWKVREAHLPTLRANAAHSRLLHPTWVAAVVARLKDEEVLTKRRGRPVAAPGKTGAKGKGRGKQSHEEQTNET